MPDPWLISDETCLIRVHVGWKLEAGEIRACSIFTPGVRSNLLKILYAADLGKPGLGVLG